MEQVIFGGFYNSLSPTATEYNTLLAGHDWLPQEERAYALVSTDGKIKNLRVTLTDGNGNPGSPGAGNKYDLTLMLNGSPTALTIEISGAATSGSNVVNEITVTGGDRVYIQCIPTSSPVSRYARWTSVFEGDSANESLLLGGTSFSALSNSATEYTHVAGTKDSPSTTEDDWRQVCPTAGTIKNLYVQLNAGPGSGGDAYRFTLRLNGATVGESSIVTITDAATTGNDTAHNLVVSAGDVLTLMIEPLNTPSATPLPTWGMTFVADTDGESIILGGQTDDLNDTATEYASIDGMHGLWWTPEYELWRLGQTCVLKKLYMLLSAAPGAGNKYTFTVRIAGASSNVVAEVADTATTGNSAALTDTVADDEYVNLMVVPTSTPTVRDAYWGLVSFINPAIAQAVGDGAVAIAGTLGLLTKLSVGAGAIAIAGVLGRIIKISVGAGAIAISGSLGRKIKMAVGNGAITISGTLGRVIKISVGAGSIAIAGSLSTIFKTIATLTDTTRYAFTSSYTGVVKRFKDGYGSVKSRFKFPSSYE